MTNENHAEIKSTCWRWIWAKHLAARLVPTLMVLLRNGAMLRPTILGRAIDIKEAVHISDV